MVTQRWCAAADGLRWMAPVPGDAGGGGGTGGGCVGGGRCLLTRMLRKVTSLDWRKLISV